MVAAPLLATSGLPDTGGLPQVLLDDSDDVQGHVPGGGGIAGRDRLVEPAMHREGAAREVALAKGMFPEAMQGRVQLPHDLDEQRVARGSVDREVELPVLLGRVAIAQMHMLHMLES